jgi:NAD-dependent DNA ligase
MTSESKDEILDRHPRKISITGKGPIPREEIVQKIEENGDIFIKTFSRQQTQILLVDDKNGNDQKLKQAKEFGIYIMTYEDYFNLE